MLKKMAVKPNIGGGPRITKVQWVFPPPSWTKVNIDGSSRDNLEVAGSGGCFRNSRGFSKACFAMLVGVQSALIMEAMAFIKSMS